MTTSVEEVNYALQDFWVLLGERDGPVDHSPGLVLVNPCQRLSFVDKGVSENIEGSLSGVLHGDLPSPLRRQVLCCLFRIELKGC